MANPTTDRSPVIEYITAAANACWSADELQHALELARHTPVPSRLEEDWRKTDPEAFPWALLETVDPGRTKLDVSLRPFAGDSTLTTLDGAAAARCRDLQLVAGDDYDAKFLYYNKALSRTPVCLLAAANKKHVPVELVQRASGPGLAAFTTVLIVERGAEVMLYDRWEMDAESVAGIGRTEIIVGEGATLTYLQEDAAGESAPLYRRARVQLERDANLLWCAATPGAAWHAARLEIALNGPNTHGIFKGIFTGTGVMHADHRTHQFHNAPQAKSDLTMKTLLAGQSHSIYQGLITVPRQSQKTDAYQQCRNLLLESGTHADAIPKLEIIADDVRCTHGASMGSLNKEQVFYLQSRGLTRRQAMVAIASGFAEEIIRFVPVEAVQERWRNLVARTIGRVQSI